MPYDPGDDVLVVPRGPTPGGVGGTYRVFGETLRGMATVFRRLAEKPVTIRSWAGQETTSWMAVWASTRWRAALATTC